MNCCISCRWYCAPEYDKDDEITVACDMYSLGVIIMELITGDRGSNPDINSVRAIYLTSHIWENFIYSYRIFLVRKVYFTMF